MKNDTSLKAPPWFRVYGDILSDRKLARVCAITKQPKVVIIGFWTVMLAMASESPERGQLLISEGLPITFDEIAHETGLPDEVCEAIIRAFISLNMIQVGDDTYIVSNWDKRQFKSDNVNERVKQYRDRKKQMVLGQYDEIIGNSGERYTPPTDKKDVTLPATLPETPPESESEAEIPNGIGAEAPSPTKKPTKRVSQESEPDTPLKQLMSVFQQTTRLKMPKKKNDEGFWWSNIREIYHIVDEDVGRGREVIKRAVDKLRSEGLTIGGPQSIVNTCRAVAAGQPLNGAYSEPREPVTITDHGTGERRIL